jgi:anti-sigma regulatory factor (Ser/Thr protein kinase)
MGLCVTVTTANQVSSSPVSRTGWQWLHCAAEMAAVASGSATLSPAMPVTPATPGWTAFPRVAMRTPGVEPGSVSAARRFTALTMARWGLTERGDDVAVVVSELLSNALRHGLPPMVEDRPTRPIRLGLVHSGPSLLCAVADPSDELPVPRDAGWLDESGRGLHVIASLSDQWGSCMARGRPGKVVWATFSTAQLSLLPQTA